MQKSLRTADLGTLVYIRMQVRHNRHSIIIDTWNFMKILASKV